MSDSQHVSEPQQAQTSAPNQGALVHRTVGRIELTLLAVAVLAFIGAQVTFVS